MTLNLAILKMYIIKSTRKPLYYGTFNKHKHKTNIIYFTKEEDSKKIAKYVSNYYFEHKKAPKIEEIDLKKQNVTQTDYFKSQIVDEEYFKYMINNHYIDMCLCNIKNNEIQLHYIENEINTEYTEYAEYINNLKLNLNVLYNIEYEEYDKRILD